MSLSFGTREGAPCARARPALCFRLAARLRVKEKIEGHLLHLVFPRESSSSSSFYYSGLCGANRAIFPPSVSSPSFCARKEEVSEADGGSRSCVPDPGQRFRLPYSSATSGNAGKKREVRDCCVFLIDKCARIYLARRKISRRRRAGERRRSLNTRLRTNEGSCKRGVGIRKRGGGLGKRGKTREVGNKLKRGSKIFVSARGAGTPQRKQFVARALLACECGPVGIAEAVFRRYFFSLFSFCLSLSLSPFESRS